MLVMQIRSLSLVNAWIVQETEIQSRFVRLYSLCRDWKRLLFESSKFDAFIEFCLQNEADLEISDNLKATETLIQKKTWRFC